MTNGEKYKTAISRNSAFEKFCNWNNKWTCKYCPLFHTPEAECNACSFAWLDLNEEEEEKPMPCPYCNNEYMEVGKAGAGMRVVKCICGYCSQDKESEAEAIAAHNRVCKAVAAYKES